VSFFGAADPSPVLVDLFQRSTSLAQLSTQRYAGIFAAGRSVTRGAVGNLGEKT
jgi:hypothetical protein